MNIEQYLELHRDELLAELFTLLRIPSISAKPDHHEFMLKCAEQWQTLLKEAGADNVDIFPTEGNPVVFARKDINPALPTVMVYGHYDVMPAEPLEQWQTEPFEPQIIDGHIVCRGADDDKGQSFMHYVVFKYLVSEQKVPCNIHFILEGEEEIGSPNLEKFCMQHKDMLQADIILVSDTSMLSANKPSITTGLRGLGYWEIEVSSANRDLHSGIFGGAVANPINELCQIIAKLQDADGKIIIPHFYDDVDEVSAAERELIAQTPFDANEYMQSLGINELHGEIGYSTLERTGIRPTLDLCGIWGGYTGDGSKTVLPAKAFAKLSCRLVPHQSYDKISPLVVDYIKSISPSYVDVKVTPIHGAESYVCPIDMPEYKAAERAYERVFGKRPLPVRRGGSIGVVAVFEQVLGIKSILMGFGLESDQIHSPNENYPLYMWENGIKTIAAFYEEYLPKQ